MPFLSRTEKEKRVKELLEQGKSTREIADEVQISFRDIGFIRRKLSGETEAQAKEKGEESIDTQVFKLLEACKRPVDVAIELDLKSDYVSRLYREWWDLRGLGLLNQLYDESKDDLFLINELYLQLKLEGLPPKKVIAAARCMEQIPFLESKRTSLQNEIQDYETQRQYLLGVLSFLRSEKVAAEGELKTLTGLIDSHKLEISELIDHVKQLERNAAMYYQPSFYTHKSKRKNWK